MISAQCSLRSALYSVFSPNAHNPRDQGGGIGSDVTTAFGAVRFVFFLSFSLSGAFRATLSVPGIPANSRVGVGIKFQWPVVDPRPRLLVGVCSLIDLWVLTSRHHHLQPGQTVTHHLVIDPVTLSRYSLGDGTVREYNNLWVVSLALRPRRRWQFCLWE